MAANEGGSCDGKSLTLRTKNSVLRVMISYSVNTLYSENADFVWPAVSRFLYL